MPISTIPTHDLRKRPNAHHQPLDSSRCFPPDHDESKPRRRWPTYLAAVLATLPLLYVLSAGPVEVIVNRFPNSIPQRVEIVYAPLVYAASATGAGEMLSSYITWWFVNTETPTHYPPVWFTAGSL